MPYYLGIDGGGTKTICLLGDEKSVLATGRSSGSNPMRVGAENARIALKAAIQRACELGKISPARIATTCIGVAGAARPQVAEVIREMVAGLLPGKIQITGDMETALEAAFGTRPGIVAIAGTGSVAHGRNSAGETARAGGWGFAVSDEGSGHWIGRSAIAAAFRSADEGSDGSLLKKLLDSWHLKNREELVLMSNASPAPDFASLMPTVQSCADSGDPIAQNVLDQAGAELGTLAVIVTRRLFRDSDIVPLAMSGGVFEHSPQVRRRFYNHVRGVHGQISLAPAVVQPVYGALEMARREV